MRTDRLQVFLSSKMRRNVLRAERQAARRAILGLCVTRVWDWETCGHADCRPPMSICLEAVRESNAFVLLLGRDLTDHTKREHYEALKHRIPDFIFVKGCRRLLKSETREYLDQQASRRTYQYFGTPRELRTHIHRSLIDHFVRTYLAGRELAIGTRPENAKGI